MIDTPGLDDTERFRVNLTEKAVEHVDAVLFLTKSGAAYGQSEKDFLLSLLRKGTVKQLLFAITQVDQTYEQHVRQARDQDEEPEPISDRIEIERRRLQGEIDSTLTALSEDSASPAMLRYREQLGNVEVVFTSAANHRDWQAQEPVRFPLTAGDPGGIGAVKRTLLHILSTESRLATTARNIESGARSLLDSLLHLVENRKSAVRNLRNREVAEHKLGTFRSQFAQAGEEFSTLTSADADLLAESLANKKKYAAAMIDVILLKADSVLAEYETSDAGRHWRTRRSGYWGYMHQLQARVANQIFPKVAELLNDQTDEFSTFVHKFQAHLTLLSEASARITAELDLGGEIRLDVDKRLSGFLDHMLEEVHGLLEAEEAKIVGMLDEFVSEDVEERISTARERTASVWGRGTTAGQTMEVRKFYADVRAILRDALSAHLTSRYAEFAGYLREEAAQLPRRALSEAKSEVARTQENIRAAAEAAISGQKDAFEKRANEIVSIVEQSNIAINQLGESLGIIPASQADSAVGFAAEIAAVESGMVGAASRTDTVPIDEDDASHRVCLTVEDFEVLRAQASRFVDRYKLNRGEWRWSYKRMFKDQFLQGATAAEVIDPYLLRPYQIRNLGEFVNRVLEVVKLRKLIVITGPNIDPDSPGCDAKLGELANQLHVEAGVELEWHRDANIHDRYVILDNGVVFKCGRGLDIFAPAGGLALSNQNLRKVKECEIDVFCSPGTRKAR